MTTIIGLSGSLRAGSFNTALLRAAAGLTPDGTQLLVKTIHGIPLVLETRPWFGGRLLVSRAAGLFDAEGRLTDEGTKKRLREFVAGFAGYVQSLR